jgi:N-methylhydantoinase A
MSDSLPHNPTYRVGVDIGGTFTDIVFLSEDGRLLTKKISSSVDNYALAIVQGLSDLFKAHGLVGRDVDVLRHGTTVGSNAILEHKGVLTGLICSEGFRDILEIRNLRRPHLYNIVWNKPQPLVERYLRLPVDERINAQGEVEIALDLAQVERVVDRMLGEGVEAIAVCLKNSYLNPVHEYAIKQVIEARAPGLPHCVSHDVLPEIKEYERTSTTTVNAYILPIVKRYLETLRASLDASGIHAKLLLMQSNGGLITDAEAARMPVNIVESGPAGGVVGAQALAKKLGLTQIVTFDMGGTTAKASIVEDGEVSRATEYSVGGGIMIGSRLLTGSGYLLRVPAIDLAEVGAGGGSIVRVDAGGAVRVGPDSAGAFPGPVCYGKGGTEPTITDCNVVLGYINPQHLVQGELSLDASKSRSAVAEKVAGPLGLSPEHAAYAAFKIAGSNMMRAIRAVSVERGRDVRGFSLFAFGGNGPLFGADLAQSLGMKLVVVPPSAGLFSSFGLLYADVEHHYSRTFRRVLSTEGVADINAAWDKLIAHGRAQLEAEGFPPERIRIRKFADMHYKGQSYELAVPAPDAPLDAATVPVLEETFAKEYERTYGHRSPSSIPIEMVNIKVIALGLPERALVPEALHDVRAERPAPPPRQVYFGPQAGWQLTPILRRSDLARKTDGPLIVEDYDSTCVVPPGATAELDGYGNILIRL